jgi:hypothetical protein
MKAISPYFSGANTPAGANLGSLINIGLLFHSQGTEYGGLETIISNGSSFQCCGFSSVSHLAISNLSKLTLCRNILILHKLYVVTLISCQKKPFLTPFSPSIFLNFKSNQPLQQAGSYTLFTCVTQCVVIFTNNSDTSCGVKNSQPPLPASAAYIPIKYS